MNDVTCNGMGEDIGNEGKDSYNCTHENTQKVDIDTSIVTVCEECGTILEEEQK